MIHLLLAWMLLAQAVPAPEAPPEDDPDNQAARLALGRAYLLQKKYQHALNAYSAVILKDPKVPEANSGRALALAGLGDVPKAVIWAKKATEMAPDDLRAWEVLGEIYLTHNYLDAPRAEATFRQMLVLDPKNRAARLQLARTLSYEKKVDEAIDLLQALAAEDPSDWAVQIKLAESYYAMRKFSRAEHILIEVLDARPGDEEARRLLEVVRGSKSYIFWVPVIAVLAIPLLYLAFRKLKRGKVIKA